MSESTSVSSSRARIFVAILAAGLIVFVGAACVAAEFAARYYERHRSTAPDYFPQMYYPHQRLRYGLVPGLDYFGWFKINRGGFRGREFPKEKTPGTFRIICLGASTTFDVGSVGTALPWPEVLEQELNKRFGDNSVEVLNFGIPGSTSLDSLIDLQTRALDYKPDLIIVYQGHNDFSYSIFPTNNSGSALYPLEDRPRSRFIRWLTGHSVLYAKTEGQINESIGKVTEAVSGIFRGETVKVGPTIEEQERSMGRGVELFRSNLQSIVAIAHLNGIPVVLPEIVLPYPDTGTENCGVCGALSVTLGNLPPGRVRATFGKYDSVIAELASEPSGVYYIDTDGFVPSQDRFYSDPIHFGPQGSRRMGEGMAEALAPIVTGLRR